MAKNRPFLAILVKMVRFGRLWYRVLELFRNSIPQAGMSGDFGNAFGAPKARFARRPESTYGSMFGDFRSSRELRIIRTRLSPGILEVCSRFRSDNSQILRICSIYRPKASDLGRLRRPFAFFVSHFRAKLWAGFAAQAHF